MYYFIFGALIGLALSCVFLSIYIFYITKKYKNEIYLLNIKYNSKKEYGKCLKSKYELLESKLYLEEAKNKVLEEIIEKTQKL